MALLDEREYRMQGFAEWYFQEDIDDALMDSEDEHSDEELLAAQAAQEYYANHDSESDSD